MLEEEGRWDIHFLACGIGCHHLTQIDIADSRKGFQAHVDHLVNCSGWQGWDLSRGRRTREEVLIQARGITPISEYQARKRFETKCPDASGEKAAFTAEWHSPHAWVHPHNTGKTLHCYGFGRLREVPELSASYYTLTTQEEGF